MENDATSGNKDTVSIGAEVLKLIFSKSANDLKVSIDSTSDQLSIKSWYSGTTYQTEVFKASDGSTLLNTQVDQLIQAMASFSQNTGMSWSQAIEERPEDVQSILSQYWVTPV